MDALSFYPAYERPFTSSRVHPYKNIVEVFLLVFDTEILRSRIFPPHYYTTYYIF